MPSAKKLNLADYRNDTLVSRVLSICDVKTSIAQILKITIIACLIIPPIYLLLLSGKGLSPTMWKALSGYSVIAAIILGLGGGLIWLANSILTDAKEIVRLTLQQSQKAADDIAEIKDGSVIIPTGRELIEQIYGELLLPIIEQVIAESFGVIGKPLLFTYRLTIGRSINFVIRKTAAAFAKVDTIESAPQKLKSSLEDQATMIDELQEFAAQAETTFNKYNHLLRQLIIIPLIVIFIVLIILLSLPILLA